MAEITEKLKELEWSQAELGRRINVTPNSVTKWKSGTRKTPKVVLLYLDMMIKLREMSK
jgi:transcriptional regulator with XRE-family HTH domain